jgi:hypothetical protein
MKRPEIPFRLLVPLFYLLYLLWVVLYVIFLPFLLLYGFALLLVVRKTWMSRGKDVLAVHSDGRDARSWMLQIVPLIEGRAVFLNYEERKNWQRWSLPAQLFYHFGPQVAVETLARRALPVVILFRKSGQPKKFFFGYKSREFEAKLERLRSELATN